MASSGYSNQLAPSDRTSKQTDTMGDYIADESVEYPNAIIQSGYMSGMSPSKREPCKAYSTLIGGFLYMIYPGSVYCSGVIATYIQSYYKIPKDDHIVADLLPACLFVNMFAMPVGSYLVQKGWNPRLMLIIGACISFPCFLIASFFHDSFAGFGVFYVLGFSLN